MSYREIEIQHWYKLHCRQCAYERFARNAGLAQEMATEHINTETTPFETTPNYDHTLEISEVTLVGRNV